MAGHSLFHPFRALGYITDDVPFAVNRLGKESFVTVSVGRAWQIYNCAKLTLVLVGPEFRQDIRALACKKEYTFAATGSRIVVCKRAHRVGSWTGHEGGILQLMCLGDFVLSLGADRRLNLWELGQWGDEPHTSIELPDDFTPTRVIHPDTYVNKVLIGGADGRMQLWNIKTEKMVYEFEGWGSGVSALCGSPALDVVAVGLADGRCVLHNLKFDEKVAEFAHAGGAGGGAVTALAFRTGGGAPVLATGGGAGAVCLWDLERRKLQAVVGDAHDGAVAALHFFPGEPRLMSSGADNAAKQWLLNAADGSARLLRFRSGHGAPPTVVQYYGDGKRLLSAGQDRAFRLFSTIQDQQSRELSQGHTARKAKKMKVAEQEVKLPRVTGLAACDVRERDWCNVITCHEGDTAAYLWRLKDCALGEHRLEPPPPPGMEKTPPPPHVVTSVGMSACGNYGFVGTAGGRVDRFNLQSGQQRGTYSRPEGLDGGGGAAPAHDGAVVSLLGDACNRLLVSAGYDGAVRVWDLKRQVLKHAMDVGSPISLAAQHRSSQLVAVGSDDLVLRLYDFEAARVVRRFRGHTDRLSALEFSSDGRWLLSASMDGTLRVWDVPGARLLQAMTLGSPVTALSLAPSMDLLATCHVGKRGIYLWANRLMFSGLSEADIARTGAKPLDVRAPVLRRPADERQGADDDDDAAMRDGETGAGDGDDDSGSDDGIDAESDSSEGEGDSDGGVDEDGGGDLAQRLGEEESGEWGPLGPMPKAPELVTLSMLPRAQWQGLVHLEVIKARNKPIEAPKKPEAAPFFLPTVGSHSGQPVFAPLGDDEDGEAPKSRVLRHSTEQRLSPFQALLAEGEEAGGEYEGAVEHLRALAPAAVDVELRSAGPLDAETATDAEVEELKRIARFLEAELESPRNFELVQAFLHLFLEVHGETMVGIPALRPHLERCKEHLAGTWGRLDSLLQDVRCMVGYFANTQG